jgi:hypothetical protein
MASATNAAMTRITATTQPQLRRVRGGLGASPRGGITCGETFFCDAIFSVGTEKISVAGSGGVSIFCVDPSNPDGAVKRRSGACGSAGAKIFVPRSERVRGGLGLVLGRIRRGAVGRRGVVGSGALVSAFVRLVRP